MADFVHLHTHSDYSLLDGAATIDHLIDKATSLKMKHLALTDHGNMFGAMKFYKRCRDRGITPIIGSEFYVAPGSRFKKTGGDKEERYYHLILLAIGERGYRNLIQLSSRSYTEGFYYKPRIDEEILEAYSQDLVCLTACLAGEIPTLILNGREDAAEKKALGYRELFGKDRFFLELQDHGIPEQRSVNQALMAMSDKTGIPLVATNDIHYATREDARAQDILICIGTNKKIHEGNRVKFLHPEFYFKSPEEMARLFAAVPVSLQNSLRIAEMCGLDLPFTGPTFPEYQVPAGETPESYLEKLAWAGLKERYPEITPEIRERMGYELQIICSMGFAGYFLIVWDFIHFARENGISVGPGRGSGASSIVAYSLRITNIDPMEYGLLFERMLNPERVEPPDLDIDFCYERRGEVIDYVTQKYGKDKVGQIVTFGTLKARAAIRDVARVLDLPYAEADKIAKLVPEGPKITMDKALQTDTELSRLAAENERYADLFEVTKRLEGMCRHTSTHAAGIVIGRESLTEYVPVYRDSKTGAVSTQYSMEDLADCGLVKMDFLGLKTLTVIDKTVKMIRKRGVEIEIDSIPLDDRQTFELLGEGRSACVFQFEGSGMQGVLKRAKPQSLAELSDLNALYRPGPMENIDQYIDAKMGRLAIQYPLPELESILKETYGVIIYQEQVMQIARQIAGYSLGQADILRSAMGKKKIDVMAKEKLRFIEGAVDRGHSRDEAVAIFNLLEPFAGYGFPKPHAAAYALLAYQTAYLKSHFPAEFMAANLSNEINNTDKLAQYIAETRSMGLEILPPDINLSERDFTVLDDRIVYGLCGIKNIGAGAAQHIVDRRTAGGRYGSVLDFLERVDLKTINRKVMEALVQAGVMDQFGEKRATLFHNLGRLLEIAGRRQAGTAFGQASLFDMSQMEQLTHVELEPAEEWPRAELLRLEKQSLGFFFSGHPLDEHKNLMEKHRDLRLDKLEEASTSRVYTAVGAIRDIKEHITRKGGKMAFANFEDDNGSVECVIFTRTFETFRELLQEDSIVVLRGKIDKNRGEPKLIVDQIFRPEEFTSSAVDAVHIRFNNSGIDESVLYQLRDFVFDRSGQCALYLHVSDPRTAAERVIRASSAITIRPDDEILEKVQDHPSVSEVWKE